MNKPTKGTAALPPAYSPSHKEMQVALMTTKNTEITSMSSAVGQVPLAFLPRPFTARNIGSDFCGLWKVSWKKHTQPERCQLENPAAGRC